MDLPVRLFPILAITLAAVGPPSFAGAPWHEGFEGPHVSWREAGSDAQYRVVRHERTQSEARSATSSERFTIEGWMGTYVHIEHPVGRPPVIDELQMSVWIRADRAGLQVAARVVLPRTPDPRTGAPVSTLVYGSAYTNVGRWQQLLLDDLPKRVARQVRVLRAELGVPVDSREVFVDAVVLNVYGGPGETNVWIDDLEVAGHVGDHEAVAGELPSIEASHPADQASSEPPRTSRPPVTLSGGVLTVDGRAFFPRAIQYRGEPLEQLSRLGFNAVWLDSPASSSLLADAARVGFWLICPPPDSLTHAQETTEASGKFEIGPEYDPVLVWFLGQELTAADLEATRLRAERVRAADRKRERPILCGPVSNLRRFSRHVDILLLDRRPLGSSLELRDYGLWIRRQPRLARPGTPIWTTVQTQPSAALYEQLATLEPEHRPPTTMPYEQVALLAHTALGAGSRGLLFLTQSDLLGADRDAQQRSMVLELLNSELALLEPWVAAGTFQASIEARPRELGGSVLRVNRSRLVLPLWSSAAAQYAPDQPSNSTVSFVVPGVPESVNPYEVVPAGLGSVKHRRVTGGMQLTLDGFGLWSSVVLAQDALLVSQLSKRAAKIGPRASRLYRDLAAVEVQTVTETGRQLPPDTVPVAEVELRLREAKSYLRQSDAHVAANEYQQAIRAARQTMRTLRALKRSQWEAAAKVLSSPVTSPGACSFASLPWHWRMGERIQASQYGRNQLAGGDFERLELLLQAGWQHMEHRVAGCLTSVDLAVEASRSGQTGLRMTAQPEDPANPPAVVETPPVWVVTPPISVEAGQLVVVHGYAQVPRPLAGSVDGLLIFDSLSGEALAERIGRTRGWQAFTLFRVAPRSGSFHVTFALTGLGEARIDDVSVRLLHSAASPATARVPTR